MFEALIVFFVVAGFSTVSYLHYKQVGKLALLLKSRDLTEVKIYEEKKQEKILPNEPEELQDAIQDKKPDEIRRMFNTSPIQI
mgnify:CR=1 FL=1